ncbi:MAG: hypothetical protein Q8O67_01490 [Deltaproteobacteria bacterium]|nr:hypothetical protein [Deltaproteobacteria bacterium]
MRLVFALLPLVLSLGCPPNGFTPEDPDAGPVDDDLITADDIGTACVYDGSSNPTNQCKRGMECVIVSGDGRFNTLGMSLPFWEDQLTVTNGDNEVGYCSLVGNATVPPVCPVGTILKLFSSSLSPDGFAATCLKPCTASAQCGADRVCDARFIDDGTGGTIGFCVSPCRSDLSHCVRSGVLQVGDAIGTSLFFGDLSGESTCNLQTGICEPSGANGTGTDGASCTSSSQCGEGRACYQANLFDPAAEPTALGFCAKRCTVVQQPGGRPEQGSCDPGEACQGGLSFGYIPVNANFLGMLVVDSAGDFATREGICLDICTEGVTECVAGTTCDAIDGNVMGANWNNVEMCAPGQIGLGS